jgi:ankyrin repeat protein
VALLLDRGAPIEALSPNRTTPLMMAAGYGAEANVDLLLARGADPKRRNDRDFDAAAFARQAGRDFLLKRLETPSR